MKKIYPKVLAVVLLIILAILTILAGTDTLKSYLLSFENGNEVEAVTTNQNEKTEDVSGKYTMGTDDSSDEKSFQNLNNSDIDHKQSDANANENYGNDSIYPKKATESSEYVWVNSVTFDTDVSIKNIHQTNNGIFVVIVTEFCDKCSNSMHIAKINEEGTITTLIEINVAIDTVYLDSSITSEGLVIATGNEQKLFLVSLDVANLQQTTLELKPAKNANIYPISTGYILLTEREDCEICLIQKGVVMAGKTIQSGGVVDMMETANSYSIFINSINGYCIINLNKEFFGFSTVSIPEKSLVKVIPVALEGKQCFIAVENSSSNVLVTKYEENFSTTTSETVSLGIAESVQAFYNDNSIIILIKNSTKRLYLASNNLDFTLSNSTIFAGIDKLFDCECHKNGFIILSYCQAEKSLSLTNISNDGAVYKKSLQVGSTNAMFVRTIDGKAIVTYEDGYSVQFVKVEIN